MLTIGQFSKISQVPAKTLRYYDEIGLLKPIKVDEQTGYRYYLTKQLQTIQLIMLLKTYELSLAEIKKILKNQASLKTKLIAQQMVITNKIDYYCSIKASIEKSIHQLNHGGINMAQENPQPITLIENPRMNLISVRETINIANIDELIKKAFIKLAQNQQQPVGPPVTLYHSEEFNPENYDVEVGIPIADETKSDTIILPTLCAQYQFKGQYAQLHEAYIALTTWITDHHYKISAVPFELYLTDPSITDPEKNLVHIYMPISKIKDC